MARGDQIYVMRPLAGMDGVYEHHGIDCGDGTVIHYYKGDEAVISRTSYESFAKGSPVYTKKQPVSFIPDVVIQRAESRLGERQYNLLSNNCEHFATWCKTGRNDSQQLVDYGFDVSRMNPFDYRRLVQEVAQDEDPVKAIELFNQAIGTLTTAQTQLQTQYNQAQNEVITWDRVARLALERQREDLARAAVERKLQFQKQAASLLEQLTQLTATQETLKRNSLVLKQRLVT